MNLPLANILHHKTRSILSALGIGIGVCMVVALTGLAEGSLYEVSDRWESVDAELIVYNRVLGENLMSATGVGLSDRYAKKIQTDQAALVEKVTPIFLWHLKLGGQNQLSAGVTREGIATLTNSRELLAGRLFKPQTDWKSFEDRLYQKQTRDLTEAEKDNFTLEITEKDLAKGGWLELVIDERLANAGNYSIGDKVQTAGHTWTIVGILPAGVMTRVFLPQKTAQYLFGSGDTAKSTIMLVKLKPGIDPNEACRKINKGPMQAVQKKQYRASLDQNFGAMMMYVSIVNGFALLIAFLFVMTTLFTMVLERKRDIAILKSCGASNRYILSQVMGESLVLTILGIGFGLLFSYGVAEAIHKFRPLLTVEITPKWIGCGIAAAMAGAMLSAIYPAWKATRVDMVEALTYE